MKKLLLTTLLTSALLINGCQIIFDREYNRRFNNLAEVCNHMGYGMKGYYTPKEIAEHKKEFCKNLEIVHKISQKYKGFEEEVK